MLVTREHLESALARVRAGTLDPAAGVHGPGSAAWYWQRESILFLGGGRAALMQLAHPYVAHGVDQHSQTRTDPRGRFQRTFRNVFAMTFGDLDQAFRAARRVHNIHTRITGEIAEDVGAYRAGHRYHANDSRALLWVHATLIDTVIEVRERVLGPMPAGEKERYYQDTKAFARLFGIPEDELPADYPAFSRYVADTVASATIAVGAPARDIAANLFQPLWPGSAPLMSWVRTVTAALLPAKLREQYRFPFGARERLLVRSSLAALGPVYRALPRSVRYLPAYTEARRRLAGRRPSPMATWIDRHAFQIG